VLKYIYYTLYRIYKMEENKEKKDSEKKSRRSKNTIIDKETGVMSGQRVLRKIGDTFYINVPKEFLEQHSLKEGDILPFAANHLLKYIPMQEK